MALKRILTQDQNLQLIQDNVEAAIIPIQTSPLIGGVLLSNLSLVSGQNNPVQHNLGRVPQIAIGGLPNVSSIVWAASFDKIKINLHCSTSCTVSVWVN